MNVNPFYYVKMEGKVFMTNLRSIPSFVGTTMFRSGLPEGSFNGVSFKVWVDEPVMLQQAFDTDPNGEPISHTIIKDLKGTILYDVRTGNCSCSDIDAALSSAQIVGRRSLDRFLCPSNPRMRG